MPRVGQTSIRVNGGKSETFIHISWIISALSQQDDGGAPASAKGQGSDGFAALREHIEAAAPDGETAIESEEN